MRKIYLFFLVVGILIIAAYLSIRFFMSGDIKKAGNTAQANSNSSNKQNKTPDKQLDLRPLFIAKMQQLIKQGSKGLYDLTVDSIEVDVLQSTAVLHKVQLTPDDKALAALHALKMAPDAVFKASFHSLKIEGINLDDAVTRKTLDFQLVNFSRPVVEVFHHKRKYNEVKRKNSEPLYTRIVKDMKKIFVAKLIVENGSFIHHNLASKDKVTRLNDIALQFNDILIDSTTQQSADRFLFAKSAQITMRNYAVKTTDDLYLFRINKAVIEAPKQMMTLSGMSLTSRYKPEAFQKKQVHRKELYDLFVPRIVFQKIDWWQLMNENKLLADHLKISDAKVKVQLDRNLPPPASKMGGFPHQLMMKLALKMHVKKAVVQNMHLSYEENSPQSRMKGKLDFDQINMRISNITNMPQIINGNDMAVVQATARFMKQVPLKARFSFNLSDSKNGGFTSSFSMPSFDGEIVNSVSQPLGLFKVEAGKVNRLKIEVQGNQHKATASTQLLYNDLKVSIYEKENDEEGLDKKGLVGLFANTFVIKDNNPSGSRKLRSPQTEFQRDPQTGFFNLVWKASLTGLLESIGASPKLASKK